MFHHQRPLLRRDIEKEQQDANERRFCAKGMQPECTAPPALLGKSFGTFGLVSQIKDQYSEADAWFLQEVANQVAVAGQDMQTYEEIAKGAARTLALHPSTLRHRMNNLGIKRSGHRLS